MVDNLIQRIHFHWIRRITSIKVNGKNAYELKGKFLDDLHNNAFSGTNEEDAVEHIEYFLRIVDPIDLPNVDPKLFTYDIERTKNYDDYMNEFNDEFEEPWDEDGVPYEIGDHICEPLRFKNGRTKWPLAVQMKMGSAMAENYREWFE
ncbi:hypothetical protein Tco_1070656 [Tanacetum coccineum]|uniref:Uncharacterized protein n=1 Tax=Tanacetum coccineum TaxID=301880 RepID=A0ABQ5HN62_9ASTR